MSVVVQLRGGLGNQLFQYAAGYALSKRRGVDLILDTVLLPDATISLGGVRRWPQQVSEFDHAGTIIDSSPRSAFGKRVRQSLAGRERALGDSRFRGLLGRGIYARETTESVAAFDALGQSARINAYCNSVTFFADQSDEIIRQVGTLARPSAWYLALKTELTAAAPIALHVRWGDYLNLKHVYGEISASYYARGVALIEQLIGHERPIWLFSDDPDGAASFLRSAVRLDRVVAAAPESSTLENLLLLSSGDGLVGANSSFSWWAAYLGGSLPGSVVFPRPLFGLKGPAEPKDWLRPDWMQVGRD